MEMKVKSFSSAAKMAYIIIQDYTFEIMKGLC
jgi:hypothetical protein